MRTILGTLGAMLAIVALMATSAAPASASAHREALAQTIEITSYEQLPAYPSGNEVYVIGNAKGGTAAMYRASSGFRHEGSGGAGVLTASISFGIWRAATTPSGGEILSVD
jgi:hypothetical protein